MTLSPEFLDRVIEYATDHLTELMLNVADQMMGPDGETYGQMPVDGAEFLSFYLDLQQYPVQIVVQQPTPDGEMAQVPQTVMVDLLPYLEAIAPKFKEQLDRQYEREFAKLIEVA